MKKPKKKLAKRSPKKKSLPEPGVLALGVAKNGEITVTDSKGKTEPLFPGGEAGRKALNEQLDEMRWSIHEGGVEIDVGGACPVQGEGTVDGCEVYFRSRGEFWSLEITADHDDPFAVGAGPGGKPGWFFEVGYGAWPDAGWMSGKHSKQCFLSAVNAWRKAGGPKATQGQLKLYRRWPVPAGPGDEPKAWRARR